MIDGPKVLSPFDKREAITLRHAANIAGKSESTVRGWCERFHIGRKIVDGPWAVSKVALQMLLDGDDAALTAYLAGDRKGPMVAPYFSTICEAPPFENNQN